MELDGERTMEMIINNILWQDVAEEIGINHQTIHNWRKGNNERNKQAIKIVIEKLVEKRKKESGSANNKNGHITHGYTSDSMEESITATTEFGPLEISFTFERSKFYLGIYDRENDITIKKQLGKYEFENFMNTMKQLQNLSK